VLVLGLIDSKPSAAALLADGKVLAAVAEERLCRMKMAGGLPRAAIREVLRLAGAAPGDVEAVAAAQTTSVFVPEATPWTGWFSDDQPAQVTGFDRVSSALAPFVGRVPLAWRAHHALKRVVFRERRAALPRALREDLGISAPVRFFDHHLCHAASAYYTCGFEPALAVTLDGGGDGLSGAVFRGRGGRLERLHRVDSFHSLGNFYSYVTALCGFQAERHEGKVTGLAAYGTPRYADALRELVGYEEPGEIRYRVPMYHRSALARIAERLPRDFDRADLAASVQLVLEEVGTRFVDHWMRRSGASDLCVAGGVFANVKLNQRVRSLASVKRLSVHPAMDDAGLAVGAALLAEAHRAGADPERLRRRLAHVYLGPEYGDDEVERALARAGFASRREPDVHEAIARLLADGAVVARFHGRMEWGPRALGHRSILYGTGDPSVNDWLNERLQRTEFMPFAPATLAERAAGCYVDLAGAEDCARFMTITADVTPRMRAQSPGVVHVDGTARPQLVDANTAPDLHAILRAYERRTGVPSLVNTSFNMHEEPIVCSPDDALRAFAEGRLDWLAIGDRLVRHPAPGERPRSAGAR
jgi:carbamoyltransferase